MIEENENERNVVDIVPLSKGRRILLFLADFFLNFILSFLLINLVVTPLSKIIIGFNAKNEQYTLNLNTRADILYGNKVLFNSGDVEKSEIVYNTSFTFRCYLSYFCIDEESPTYVYYSQYGHKQENDVFKTYFTLIRDEEETLKILFDKYNAINEYFIRDGLTFSLKEEIREQVTPLFILNQVPNTLGQAYINNLEKNLFTPLYSEMMTSILKNDLTFEGASFIATNNAIHDFEKKFNTMITYDAFIALFLSSLILYFIVPICNKNKRTIGMMLMKIQRVNIYKLTLMKNYDVFMLFVYQFLLSFLIAFFIPIGYLTFIEIFKITVLFIFGIFSLLLSLASLIFVIGNGYNRSLSDYVTRTVYLSNDSLDEIYRARGYLV